MKFLDVLLLSMALVFLVIGIDQSIKFGIQASYWAFMCSAGFLFWYQYRYKARKEGKK
jgi:hypothetical protein